MMLGRRFWFGTDWPLVLGLVLAAGVGVAVIYSATQGGPNPDYYQRQILWIVLGLVLMLVVMAVDYHTLVDQAEFFYLAVAGLLIYLLLFGSLRAGTNRWLELGIFTLHSGELAKLASVTLLAKYLAAVRKNRLGAGEVAITGVLVGIPVLLVILQPDLGTAATLVFAYAVLCLLAGLRARLILVAAGVFALALPIGWSFVLKDYQKERVLAFVDPNVDPRGAGYQSIQSTIAVGSGGLTGKGWLKGSQSQLQFLPAPHTDFVFAVVGEELGFVGVVGVIVLYLMITLRSLDAARRARDRLGIYLVAGVLSMFVFQALYNMAMVGGLVPIKGFPLPLVSYGGSSMMTTLVGFGLILNVRMRRFVN
ncbi:MAG: rod shape-determining protein RodA [Gammaproteobacteria bacterium]